MGWYCTGVGWSGYGTVMGAVGVVVMDDPDADPHSIRLIGTIHTSTAPTNTNNHYHSILYY